MQNKDKARLERAKAAAGAVGQVVARAICATCLVLVLVGGTHFYTKHQTQVTLRATHKAEIQAEQAKRFGRESAEFHLLVQAVLEECGGVPDEWRLCFEAKIGRVDSDMFPNTIEAVLKQKGSKGNYQFSFVNDDVHPHVVTEQGDAIRATLAPLWQAYQAGTYEYQFPGIHSFCVLQACLASVAYFGQFEILHEADGHVYFGGRVLGEEAIAANKFALAALTEAVSLTSSPRPRQRPSATDRAVSLAFEF